MTPFGLFAFALMLVGCTATSRSAPENAEVDIQPAMVIEDARSQAAEEGHSSQEALLSDGAVTFDDYEASVGAYITCVTERGFQVDGPVLNPADNELLLLQVLDGNTTNAASAQADTDCRSRHVNLVEGAYRALTEPRMEPALIEETNRCLDSEGLDYSGDEFKFEDYFPAGVEDSKRLEMVSSCVSQSLYELHPNLPFVALGF
ncbi:hypothetical protein D9V28_07085 [Mycetocola zhadangensis]|uniref:DUF3558 domain-containing protein n=2 Tax=Mycetocola zhadangensis TaxID=1164595 RepID=A0A3L7J0M0_9MICO|nr:hypothetical protein D9V28_07085 [Mycetocola zhadangensis]